MNETETRDAGAPAENTGKPRKNQTREFIEAILVAAVLALFIRTFIVQAFKIPSGSMIPTLLVGDHILVNKFVYGIPIPFGDGKFVEFSRPDRGEVIVFRYPKDPSKDFIKRVVGVPGDTVAMRDGVLTINGEIVSQAEAGPYVYEEVGGSETVRSTMYREQLGDEPHDILLGDDEFPPMRTFGPITVPPDQIFVMGDNRDRSNDSRFWGMVDIDAVQGRAMVIYWSWDRDESSVRWSRLGDVIR